MSDIFIADSDCPIISMLRYPGMRMRSVIERGSAEFESVRATPTVVTTKYGVNESYFVLV